MRTSSRLSDSRANPSGFRIWGYRFELRSLIMSNPFVADGSTDYLLPNRIVHR